MAASTFGSLAGTLLTAMVGVPFLGVHATACAFAALLALCGFAALGMRASAVAAFAGGLALIPFARVTTDGIVRETPYGVLELDRVGAGYDLRVNGIRQAGSTLAPYMIGRGALLAVRQYAELLPYLRPHARTVLNVGLGGGNVPRVLEAHGLALTNIEINPVLVDVVRDELGYDGDTIVGDGRARLRRLDRRFDFVVLDVFQGESLAAHMMTREAFEEVRARLTPDGIVCVHLIAPPHHRAVASVARTLDAVFKRISCMRTLEDDGLQDLFVLASDGALDVPPLPAVFRDYWNGDAVYRPRLDGGVVITDDKNPLEWISRDLASALRRQVDRQITRASRPR